MLWASVHLSRVRAKRGQASEAADDLQRTLATHADASDPLADAALRYESIVVELLVQAERIAEAESLANTVASRAEQRDPLLAAMMCGSIAETIGPRLSIEAHEKFYSSALKKLINGSTHDPDAVKQLCERAAVDLSKRDIQVAQRWRQRAMR